ncbi:WD40/YVTN/BNR-like repeat-containing protein [Halosolutus gelatinilyticus]|uniref:WD40/YVTN/BNR-like repeat-containing protein n=1 Tax=Halosolutus gelatinilyticus TaxID=2931975 RepID=UPI001FF4F1DB|nr:hypothetical protein [Halosolutus gelatinilyticus]
MATRSDPDGFGAFFRRYTKTWMHAVAAAGLTAFGVLATVHRGFVVLAIASYVVPPIVLYFSRTRGRDDPVPTGSRSPTDAALAEADRSNSSAGSDSGSGRDGTRTTPDSSGESAESGRRSASVSVAGRTSGTDTRKKPESDATGDDPGSEPEREPRWRSVESPTDATLFDAAIADETVVAAGTGGVVLASRGDEWSHVLIDGPSAQGQDLRAIDATGDGEIVWVAGDGGAVGRIEVETERHADYSAPNDRTDNLTGLAVAGAAGDETILLTNGSGEVIRGRYRDGDLAWEGPATPGGGSSVSGVALFDAEIGYCCDTNAGVFRTDDGGRTFDAIGVDGVDGTLTDVTGDERGCYVSTDAGVVHRFDGETWTPERVTDGSLSALARYDDRLATIGDAGAVYDRSGPTADWERTLTGANGPLHGVAIGADRSVAVGADGTVVERERL